MVLVVEAVGESLSMFSVGMMTQKFLLMVRNEKIRFFSCFPSRFDYSNFYVS